MAELRLATGVKNAVLDEHIRSLRWKGLVMFESLTLSPSALAEFQPASSSEPVVDNRLIGGEPRDWIADRHARIAAAIGFLKSKAILVSVVDRADLVRTCRISGKQYPCYAEGVIELAIELGWEAAV